MLCAIPIHGELIRTAAQAIELRSVPRWYGPYAVQDAFQAGRKAEWLKDRAVVVVDDVMTTGSTVREVARVMRVKASGMLDEYPNLSAYVARGEARPQPTRLTACGCTPTLGSGGVCGAEALTEVSESRHR